MNIGSKIKEYRNNRGLTQVELATKANISRSYLSDVENNRYNASVETLTSIAQALTVPVSALLEEWNKQCDSTQLKEEVTLFETGEFNTPEAAIKFILKQPAIMGYGGFDVNKMSAEEIIEFANELLNQLKLLGYKYKK